MKTEAEFLQDAINELQGRVPELHLHSIALRISSAEYRAELLATQFAEFLEAAKAKTEIQCLAVAQLALLKRSEIG